MLQKFIILSLFLLASASISAQLSDFSQLRSSLDRLTDIKIDSSIKIKPLNTVLTKTNYNTFYQSHLGAMCKLENTINKSTVFPVSLRLGTVQYVDRLEGKVEEYTPIKR